jgi:hypothetical protein
MKLPNLLRNKSLGDTLIYFVSLICNYLTTPYPLPGWVKWGESAWGFSGAFVSHIPFRSAGGRISTLKQVIQQVDYISQIDYSITICITGIQWIGCNTILI